MFPSGSLERPLSMTISVATDPDDDEPKVTRGASFREVDGDSPPWFDETEETDELVDDVDPLTRAFRERMRE